MCENAKQQQHDDDDEQPISSMHVTEQEGASGMKMAWDRLTQRYYESGYKHTIEPKCIVLYLLLQTIFRTYWRLYASKKIGNFAI